MGKFLNDRPTRPAAPSGQVQFLDSQFQSRYPALTEYLTETAWADGKPRQTSTLHLFVDQGQLKCFLNDRAAGRSACVSAATLEGILVALERGLQDDDLTWRWDTKKGYKKQ